MEKVSAFKSDDGSLHTEEINALRADVTYWKKRYDDLALRRVGPAIEDQDTRRAYQEAAERGGHQ